MFIFEHIHATGCKYLFSNIYIAIIVNYVFYQEESNEKKPVMVFIHGGAFNYGSGSLDFYSPDYLLDENVIVVTINYRLNILGKYIGINVIIP